MDFGVLPPEVNSGLIYTGPGSGPMLATATAWAGLATVLSSVAEAYGSVIAGLTFESWLGPASASMAAATAPYAVWLSATAAQAEQTAAQAETAAAAFEAAYAMTVPPPLIAANRSQLMSLVATNILGQNSPAIEALQAEYVEMWAQDVAAMYGYAGESEAASTLTPFTQPLQFIDPAGLAAQAAAVAASAGMEVGTNAQAALGQLTAATAQTLPGLVSPAAAALPAASVTVPTAIGELDVVATYIAAIGTGSLVAGITNASVSAAKLASPNGNSSSAGTKEEEPSRADDPASAGVSVSKDGMSGSAVSADVGQAATVGGLTVPHGWTMAAPEIKLAVESLPSSSVSGVPTDLGGAPSGLLTGMALASLAGRGLGGAGTRSVSSPAKAGEGQPQRKPTVVVIQKPPPAGELPGNSQ